MSEPKPMTESRVEEGVTDRKHVAGFGPAGWDRGDRRVYGLEPEREVEEAGDKGSATAPRYDASESDAGDPLLGVRSEGRQIRQPLEPRCPTCGSSDPQVRCLMWLGASMFGADDAPMECDNEEFHDER